MVNVLVTSESRYPVNRSVIKKAVVDFLAQKKVKDPVEISVAIVGKIFIFQAKQGKSACSLVVLTHNL